MFQGLQDRRNIIDESAAVSEGVSCLWSSPLINKLSSFNEVNSILN